MRYMQIGEVSERTGLTQRTLRYYESIGLLAPATRMEGGFRLYTDDDLRRLEQIVQLKRLLGFSLAEIRQIVDADETLRAIKQVNKVETDPQERRGRLEHAITILEEQRALVQSRIAAMHELQASYERRLERLRGRVSNLDSQLATSDEGPLAAHPAPARSAPAQSSPEPAAAG